MQQTICTKEGNGRDISNGVPKMEENPKVLMIYEICDVDLLVAYCIHDQITEIVLSSSSEKS